MRKTALKFGKPLATALRQPISLVPMLVYPNSQENVMATGAPSACGRSSRAAYPILRFDKQEAVRARSSHPLFFSGWNKRWLDFSPWQSDLSEYTYWGTGLTTPAFARELKTGVDGAGERADELPQFVIAFRVTADRRRPAHYRTLAGSRKADNSRILELVSDNNACRPVPAGREIRCSAAPTQNGKPLKLQMVGGFPGESVAALAGELPGAPVYHSRRLPAATPAARVRSLTVLFRSR